MIKQPVIRQKLAAMVSMNQAISQWIDFITFQMNNMTYSEVSTKLAGTIALCKFQVTRTSNMIADEAVQLFGGRGITKTGMGRVIEMFNRTYVKLNLEIMDNNTFMIRNLMLFSVALKKSLLIWELRWQ